MRLGCGYIAASMLVATSMAAAPDGQGPTVPEAKTTRLTEKIAAQGQRICYVDLTSLSE
jgi:hypothetical protein